MTALNQYDRLEASGLWRARPDDQRKEVIVSIGEATLVITDLADRALAHWSLAAVERANPDETPAVYFPDGDPGETLELAADAQEMIDAIAKLQRAIERSRPHPGRLRLASVLVSVAAVAALVVFWLPGAMLRHTVSVVPDVNRATIGRSLLKRIERVSGPACNDPAGQVALARLGTAVGARDLVVVRSGVRDALVLPGNIIVLNRSVIEDFEEPDVVAGFIIMEQLRAKKRDPLEVLLRDSGVMASFHLITTGTLTNETLDAYAQHLLTAPRPTLSEDETLAGFSAASVRSTPYAYAMDITGENVLGLIEADPMAGQVAPVLLKDSDWIRLQNICGG
ncbi:hypothetical protein SuNHUV7_23060 (plasmid) [Pseudoseohaeicola sp. NH-UV-7]|uniref:hypothetical protein n=1 Tax=unclassified Sulfitobacter TaxID=196795 RepID=UPI000E0BC33B|nr:hypothetical protein [Sulfitobacter sp. JL08]AXI55800.1 hypothetical protein C1J05_15990 [Sulfitobacter sp. JL08]